MNILLEQLKQATAEDHALLEGRSWSTRMQSRQLTMRHYAAVLRGWHEFYANVEPKLCDYPWPLLLSELNYEGERRKLPLLARDLAALGQDVASLPHVFLHEALELSSDAKAVGALYVIEGSMLGAQVMVQHVQRVLGLTPETGAAFYTGYGAATRPLWEKFRVHVAHWYAAERVRGNDPTAEACLGARAMFAFIDRWMENAINQSDEGVAR